MPHTNTPYHEYPKPGFEVDRWQNDFYETLDALDEDVIKTGPFADRPSNPPAGRMYLSTDGDSTTAPDGDPTLFYFSGTAWEVVAGGEGGSGDGAGSLSELDIDVTKHWQGHGINGLGRINVDVGDSLRMATFAGWNTHGITLGADGQSSYVTPFDDGAGSELWGEALQYNHSSNAWRSLAEFRPNSGIGGSIVNRDAPIVDIAGNTYVTDDETTDPTREDGDIAVYVP